MMPGVWGRRKAPGAVVAQACVAGYARATPVRSASLLAAVALWPLAARAGETDCHYEAGVLVVPAEVMGVAGDYVLDTGSAHTLLAETQAQGAGFAETQLTGEVRLADLTIAAQPVAVARLDERLYALPTPVAGVNGADLLAPYVVDVSFAPCRVALWRPGEAPRFRARASLPLAWAEGRPTALARVADDDRTLSGDFVLATGADTPVRLRDDLADAPGAARREGLYPYGALRPKLRALSFAGELFEAAPAGLEARAELPATGEIGAPVLSRFRLRFDFPARRLQLAKEKGPPDRSSGP